MRLRDFLAMRALDKRQAQPMQNDPVEKARAIVKEVEAETKQPVHLWRARVDDEVFVVLARTEGDALERALEHAWPAWPNLGPLLDEEHDIRVEDLGRAKVGAVVSLAEREEVSP